MLLYRQYTTLAEAVIDLTRSVAASGVTVDASDWNTRRKEAPAVFTISDPLDQTRIPKATICNDAALTDYANEILLGTLDHAVSSGKEAYTYHARMVEPVNQIDFCINELKRNRYSNRAVITIRRPEDSNIDDQPCLQLIQFKIYEDRLNMTTFWRSRDLFKALYMNCFALILFGRETANALGVKMGVYTDHSESLHLYERDWSGANSISEMSDADVYIDSDDFWIDYANPYGN